MECPKATASHKRTTSCALSRCVLNSTSLCICLPSRSNVVGSIVVHLSHGVLKTVILHGGWVVNSLWFSAVGIKETLHKGLHHLNGVNFLS